MYWTYRVQNPLPEIRNAPKTKLFCGAVKHAIKNISKCFLVGSITTSYQWHKFIASKLDWKKSVKVYCSWTIAQHKALQYILWKVMFSSFTPLPMWHLFCSLVIKKSEYKERFMSFVLGVVKRGIKLQDYLKQFSVKGATHAVANAWNGVDK